MHFQDSVILAPMVRAGSIPLRMLALEYGADIVFGEEIIDRSIVQCKKVFNEELQTTDFVKGTNVIFRTTLLEKEKLVYQIGTADPVHALKAAECIAEHVSAVDVNMGCPKHFSIQGGMGAALLAKPELACDILKTLVRNLSIPVTCKVRLLDDMPATIDFCRRVEACGISALTVHCRHIHERPKDAAHWDLLKEVVSSVSIPVIANGDVLNQSDIAAIKEKSGVAGVMIARGALTNPSIFRKQGVLSEQEAITEYVKKCVDWDNHPLNTKHVLLRYSVRPTDPMFESIVKAKTHAHICELFGLSDHLATVKQRRPPVLVMPVRESRKVVHENGAADDEREMPVAKKIRIDDDAGNNDTEKAEAVQDAGKA